MFTMDSIKKVVRQMKEAEARYQDIDVEDIPMCISCGNKKIGRVMNVSLPPILSCGNCKECKHLCYDIKACLQYPQTVIDARIRNWTILLKDRDEYFRRIEEKISRRRKNKFFRWHVAGDIIDLDYFVRMCEIASRHPDFVFWTYTKMYDIVNTYIENGGVIPSNFSVMFSEWRGMPMNNPHGMPEFRVVFKDDAVKPSGFYCGGNCDFCKAHHCGCVAGQTVYCNEH